MAGIPTIFISLLGRNPFPNGAIALTLFAWALLALLFAVVRGNDALSFGRLLKAPIVATVVLAVLLIVRLGAHDTYAYGSVKVRLFVAENLVVLIAGVAVARYNRHFHRLLAGLVLVACATSVVLARGLASGQVAATVGGRFSLDQQASPIGLGRDAATGILVAIFLVLAARSSLLRLFALGAIPLIAVSFIAAGSRGPVIGLVVGLLVLLALALRERKTRARVLLVAIAAVGGALLVSQLVPGQDIQRSLSVLTGSGNGLSSNGRSALWHQAWQLFLAHPLFGAGTGAFSGISPIDLFPHNIFLEVGAEVGIIGVIAVVVVVLGGVRALWRADVLSLGKLRVEVALVGALLAAAFVNAQVSSDITSNSSLWLAVGLALGLEQRAVKAVRPDPSDSR